MHSKPFEIQWRRHCETKTKVCQVLVPNAISQAAITVIETQLEFFRRTCSMLEKALHHSLYFFRCEASALRSTFFLSSVRVRQ